MIHGSKKEHDIYIEQMLKNTTCDEVTFNIDTKPSIPNYETAYTLLLEELTETEEALKVTKHNLQEFFTLIRMNKDSNEMTKHMELIAYKALDIMQEAMHTRAVAMKAIQQIEKAPTDGNQ
ncbi:MAG: hypothetical protein K0Q65_448 [Clostridia bacterium]|jgi:hypothetical protein|nr:hypothetical protein [Clostridia bacterium]